MKNKSIALTLVVSPVLVLVVIAGFSIFGSPASLPRTSGYGANPELPTPQK
jgi:hypothetical protein